MIISSEIICSIRLRLHRNTYHIGLYRLHGPWMLPDKPKFTVLQIYIKLASTAFDETSSYWSAKKSQLFIGQLKNPCFWLVTIAHRLGSTFTEIDRNGFDDRIGRLIALSWYFPRFPHLGTRFCAIVNTWNTGLSVENNSLCRLHGP